MYYFPALSSTEFLLYNHKTYLDVQNKRIPLEKTPRNYGPKLQFSPLNFLNKKSNDKDNFILFY